MSTENSKADTWGQLMVTPGTQAGHQRALPPDIEAHIRAVTAPDAEPLPLDTQHWLKAKFREYVAASRQQRLDEVMGLAPVSARRDWRTIDRLEARDAWLVRAFEMLDSAVSEYKRCLELSHHIYVFEETIWPKLEGCVRPPEEMTPLRKALFFAFKLGEGEVPHGWVRLKEIVQNPLIGSGTSSILWHIHAAAYDQSRSTNTINPSNYLGQSRMNILAILAILSLHAWDRSAELRARHGEDPIDYYERTLRQAMECAVDEGEYPALITDVLSPEQIADMLQRTGVKSL